MVSFKCLQMNMGTVVLQYKPTNTANGIPVSV